MTRITDSLDSQIIQTSCAHFWIVLKIAYFWTSLKYSAYKNFYDNINGFKLFLWLKYPFYVERNYFNILIENVFNVKYILYGYTDFFPPKVYEIKMLNSKVNICLNSLTVQALQILSKAFFI